MAPAAFDIYQGPSGYVAVTSPVRRQILAALAEGDRQLPELVELTGRAKPTLSSVHVRELLAQGLVSEHAHATDARRKVYRLAAKKIGSSDVPLDDLRGAVHEYVKASSPEKGLPLALVVQALDAAPAGVEDAAVRAQAVRLGELSAELVEAHRHRELLLAAVQLLEDQGLARAASLDLEQPSMQLRPGPGLEGVAAGRSRAILAGWLEGLWRARSGEARVTATGRGARATYRIEGL